MKCSLALLCLLCHLVSYLSAEDANWRCAVRISSFHYCSDGYTTMDLCVICKEILDNGEATVVLREKGSTGINNASELRKDNISTSAGQSVHQNCRRNYCNKNVISRDSHNSQQSTPHRSLRSQEPAFSFSEHCLFCGNLAKKSGKKRGLDVFPVRTSDFQSTISNACLNRNDVWAEKVSSRIAFAQDLHAVDAVYHQVCNINFRTGKNVPVAFETVKEIKLQHPGRPTDNNREAAFLKVLNYLKESDDEQVTVSDLVEKMKQFGCGDEYSSKYMKNKLREHFGNEILITSANGRHDVVTFRSTASFILHSFYDHPKLADSEAEKLRLIRTAADLIKNEIKTIPASRSEYPTPDVISSLEENRDFVPESLRLLLRCIFSEMNAEVKITSVGQAIVQAARPRSIIAPLQIGLAVQMHHHFASKFLIDSLNNHGFCSSCSEVKKFETSAAQCQGTDIPGITPGHFIQYVADNADHNTGTIDGFNTFHGMGIIAAVTPGTKRQTPIPRCSVSSLDLSVGKINIHFFRSSNNSLSTLVYEALKHDSYEDPSWNLDVLWKVSWPLRSPRIGWSGMMQTVCQGTHPGMSSIAFLPMIDMNASDMSCVYSTLRFVSSEAKRHGVKPIITFDQPLWWKAQTVIASEPSNSDLRAIVLRLGGFHTQMSFLGCIGHIMSGSGLQEVLQTVYAPNSVLHMLSGKAVSWAVRGYFLVDTVLNAMITSTTFKVPLKQMIKKVADDLIGSEVTELVSQEDTVAQDTHPVTNVLDEDLSSALELYDKLMNEDAGVEDICSWMCIGEVQKKLNASKAQLLDSRTARLWIQYMNMVDIIRQFIKAERTGNWHLHIHTLKCMLPYFAAAGHNLYTKSVRIYLQQMIQLETQHPDVYAHFTDGYHVIRRSDRFWAGLSSDLVIEQVLMRGMKATGGLTRGRGLTESQRTQWLLSLPACADVNTAMQKITETDYITSDQHKDMTEARKIKDSKDLSRIHEFLSVRNPFSSDLTLRNIVTGMVADKTANADKARDAGQKILQAMNGINVLDYTFKKKDQVVILNQKSSPSVDGETIHVDPQLLFQRLVTAARNVSDNPAHIFKYELCGHPSSLFEQSGLMRAANKPQLANAIWNTVKGSDISPPNEGNMQFVLDGGSLLQRLPWPRGSTFDTICTMYVDYVQRKYSSPVIVFDGYQLGPSIKDSTHLRRYGSSVGAQVNFVGNMPVISKKEQFLSNSINKQKFIDMLSKRLEESGCKVIHAECDADLLIVQTAVESACTNPTMLIGEDTDLLVLLCYHVIPTSENVYFRSEGKQATKYQKVWNIHWLQHCMGSQTCSLLPFVHAVAGCDTTSRLFGIGKGLPLKKLTSDLQFRKQAEVFCRQSTKEDITSAGEKALLCLYGGSSDENLDFFRYRRFCEKVTTNTCFVQVHTLPPTSAAARYHSERVYLQVQQWIGNLTELNPEHWGWVRVEDKLQPKMTDLPPAPVDLLRVIRCNCKSDCDTKRCTCRKHGLDCSVACGECRGINCTNVTVIPEESLVDEISD